LFRPSGTFGRFDGATGFCFQAAGHRLSVLHQVKQVKGQGDGQFCFPGTGPDALGAIAGNVLETDPLRRLRSGSAP
jgi:hypothetical protein